MGLFTKVSDIISANLNDMIERFENPERILRQAVREMEAAISKAMDGAAKVIASEKLLAKQLAEQDSRMQLWHNRAVSAVAEGDDDNARTALTRKKEHEKLVEALTEHQAEVAASSQSLRRQIDAMRAKLNEARRKLVVLTARKQAADARQKLIRDVGGVKCDVNAFSKFDRMSQQVEHAEAETEALFDLTQQDAAFEAEDSYDIDVETELQSLKANQN